MKKEDKSGNMFDKKRKAMVEYQLKARGIRNEYVLSSMEKVPREKFIPEEYLSDWDAYGDYPVPIGENQTISQPYIVALMTELIAPEKNHKILEIGTGSGYQAAVLCEIGCRVYSVEIIEKLGKNAEKTLKELGYSNIRIKIGDGFEGWEEFSPYDGIIITCSAPVIPEPLISQLKDKGRIVIPVGGNSRQKLQLIEKNNGKMEIRDVADVRFVPMTGNGIKKK